MKKDKMINKLSIMNRTKETWVSMGTDFFYVAWLEIRTQTSKKTFIKRKWNLRESHRRAEVVNELKTM